MGNEQTQLPTYKIHSPHKTVLLTVGVNQDSLVWYELKFKNKTVINGSNVSLFTTAEENLLLASREPEAQETDLDETWEQPWGEQRFVRNNYQELALKLDDATIRFRVFDDGLGFRYELAKESPQTIGHEETIFNLSPKTHAWWIPALGQNHYEHQFKRSALSGISTAHTPVTLELPNGLFAAIHEAALYNYGAMNLVPSEHGLTSSITPLKNGTVGEVPGNFISPWRTVSVSESAAELGNVKIMLNLNEPSKIEDTSWIQPLKFMGIWWGMFLGTFTWASGDKHGATTANAFKYINAASRLGIRGLLIEGWNVGWDGDWTQNGKDMNYFQAYPDFDLAAVTQYASEKGIEIVGHHETSGAITHYESELPEAYDFYKQYGVRYIKTGYVSPRMDTGELHSSQAGVNHYQRTVEWAASRQIMLDIHEPVKGTGIERTWPNLLTREGVMGQEYEGGAIQPAHTATIPFTRSLSGPMDYTPGIFNLNGTSRKVQSTLGKQLALYVVLFSPMQMAADLPEHYEDHPAFEFIRRVPVSWERTVPLAGDIGQYYAVARQDRESEDWFLGAVTNEQPRTLSVKLDFLPEHQPFTATIYADASDAHWQKNPASHTIESKTVTNEDSLDLFLAPGGGVAVHFSPQEGNHTPYPESF